MKTMERTRGAGAQNSETGNTMTAAGFVVFGIGCKASLLQRYPGTKIFREILHSKYEAYQEANQEGRDPIIQGIVDRFSPDAFFKLQHGELSPLDKQLAKMEVKTSMASLRGYKTSKEKENKMRNEEQEKNEGTPCVDDLVFICKGTNVSIKNRATVKFEKRVLLTLSSLRNTEGKIYFNGSNETAEGLARRLLKEQKEENCSQNYFQYDLSKNKYYKQTDELALVSAMDFIATVKNSHNNKQRPIEKRCASYGINLSKEKQDEEATPTVSNSGITNPGHEITDTCNAVTLSSSSTLSQDGNINAARRGTKRPFNETNAVNLDDTDDSNTSASPFRDRVGPSDHDMVKYLLDICESDPNFKHVFLFQLYPERTNLDQSLAEATAATRNTEKQLGATMSENEMLQKSNEENEQRIAELEAKLVSSQRREEELKSSIMEELKSALSLRTNLEKSLAESTRATQNAEKQLEATMSDNERLKGNEQRIAELEAKLDSIKEDHQAALSRNRRLRTNNGALRTSNEQNEHTISGLEAKIGREKDLEEISKHYEDAYKSMAEKNGVLEGQLQAVKDWFENEARLRQQLEDQIEAIRREP